MICKKCKKEIENDATFCVYCGTKVEEDLTANYQENSKNEENEVSSSGSNSLSVMILAVVAVLLFVVVGFVVWKIIDFSTNGVEKSLAYVKGGTLYYTKNMDSEKEPLCVTDVEVSNGGSQPWFTEDGKYLYFYQEERDEYKYTLCRVPVKKLGGDKEKNEKYIEEIETNIYGYEAIGNNQLVYQKGEKLIYWNNGEETEISRDVSRYIVSDDKAYISYVNEDEQLYTYNVSTNKNELLSENGANVYNVENPECIWSNTEILESDGTIYLSGTGVTEEEIHGVSHVVATSSKQKCVYYLKERTEEISLYSFVQDAYGEVDASIKEPIAKDYMTEVAESEVLPFNSSEYIAGYYEIYDYEVYSKYRGDLEDYQDDYEDFYDYLDYDDDLGFCYYEKYDDDLDTYQIFYYDEIGRKWYKFNNNDYNNKLNEYNQVRNRIELREELKNTKKKYTYYDLYCFEAGKEEELLAENVAPISVKAAIDSDIIVYTKILENKTNCKIEELDSVYDLEEQLVDSYGSITTAGSYMCIFNGKEVEFELDGTLESFDVSEDGKEVLGIVTENEGEGQSLVQFKAENDGVKTEEITDSFSSGAWCNGKYYYACDMDDGEYDLYYYTNGKSKEIAEDILYRNGQVLENGEIASYEDYDYENGGELLIYGLKGDKTKIDNNVTSSVYISESRVLYQKDDALYVYNGKKENKRIVRDVSEFAGIPQITTWWGPSIY